MRLNEIKVEMEKSRTKSLHITRYQLFSRLKCTVSHHAISLLKNEYNDRCKKIGTNAEACGCEMRNNYGLPCAHEMCELMNTYTPIDLLDVHIFWKTLDMEGRNFQEKQGLRQTSSQRIDELVAMMKQYPPDQQYFFANVMYNILFPESTNLKQPIYRPHKGRPKHNPTKKDKSGWEHSEKNATTGLKKKQNSNKDSKQDADKKSKGHINVRGDGHCGFRVIATFEYGDENKWLDVRRDLQDELTKHVELHRDREVLGSLSMVVATRYQRIVTSWSKNQPVTFLPLETRLVDQPPSIYINLAYVWSNHYISLHMPPNIPLPPIFSSNIHNGCSDVQQWASTIFKDQLDLYRQLNGDK
ncbi:uncharacterized protein LOC110732081 [Chenopodium quinoa]|uniref:uncharacterized protein LOC110732081 n=1 Tax=Chenopodium quinoa TaxID=63459 RepID=UPI000B77F06C|nr:uncharacterized protein LOC110732081 [Chenopodium quinoa]